MKKPVIRIHSIYKFALDNFKEPFTIGEFYCAYTEGLQRDDHSRIMLTGFLSVYARPGTKYQRFIRVSKGRYRAIPFEEFLKIRAEDGSRSARNLALHQVYNIFEKDNSWRTAGQIKAEIKKKFEKNSASSDAIGRCIHFMATRSKTCRLESSVQEKYFQRVYRLAKK